MDEEREAGALAERVRYLEHRIEALELELGKTQSDMVIVKTELAAERGRKTMRLVIDVAWPVVVGMIVLIVVMVVMVPR